MPRRKSDSFPSPDLTTLAGRIAWLLINLFGGNLRRMAEAVGLSHSVLSKIIGGRQGAGRRAVEAIAAHPKVNPCWLLHGIGEPLLAVRQDAPSEGWPVPVSRVILPGPPEAHRELLTGTTFPLAGALYRPTRYWLRVAADDPITREPAERVAPGDLLLLDADPEIWRANRQVLVDALVALRVRGDDGLSYALARVGTDAATGCLTSFTYQLTDSRTTPGVGAEPSFRVASGEVRRGRMIELDDLPAGTSPNPVGKQRPRRGHKGEPERPRPEAQQVAEQPVDRSGMPGALDIRDVVALGIMLVRY